MWSSVGHPQQWWIVSPKVVANPFQNERESNSQYHWREGLIELVEINITTTPIQPWRRFSWRSPKIFGNAHFGSLFSSSIWFCSFLRVYFVCRWLTFFLLHTLLYNLSSDKLGLKIKYRSFLCATTWRYSDVTSRLIGISSINIWLSICFLPYELLTAKQKKLSYIIFHSYLYCFYPDHFR